MDGLAELQPSRDVLETRRAGLQSEIRTVEEEQAKLVAAIAVAGHVDALAGALRDRGPQRSRLRAELAMLDGNDKLCGFDIKRVERDLRERLAEWRDLLRRESPVARQIVTVLLDGRIVCTLYKDERCHAFAGRVKFDALLSGAGLTQGMVPLRSRISNRNSPGNPSVSGLKRCS